MVGEPCHTARGTSLLRARFINLGGGAPTYMIFLGRASASDNAAGPRFLLRVGAALDRLRSARAKHTSMYVNRPAEPVLAEPGVAASPRATSRDDYVEVQALFGGWLVDSVSRQQRAYLQR